MDRDQLLMRESAALIDAAQHLENAAFALASLAEAELAADLIKLSNAVAEIEEHVSGKSRIRH